MKTSKRKAILCKLEKYCIFANENDFMEVTEWSNQEGADIHINAGDGKQDFSLTWGQFDLLKKLIKKITE